MHSGCLLHNYLASFNHGSADNIGVITSFICGQLQSACKANAAAISTCQTATTAANAAAAGTGAQADAFNAAFGVQTDFAAVAVINNQGQTVSPGTSGSATSAAGSASTATGAVAVGTTTSASSATGATTGSGTNSGSGANSGSGTGDDQSATSEYNVK